MRVVLQQLRQMGSRFAAPERGVFARLLHTVASSLPIGRPSQLSMVQNDVKTLTDEIEVTDALRRQLFLEVHDLHKARQQLDESRTCKGRYFNLLGYIMSVICVYKIVMASINVIFQRKQKQDPISRWIEIVFRRVLEWDGQ